MKNFRKSVLILFAVVLVFSVSFMLAENHDTALTSSAAAAEIIDSGSCGDNVTYTLDSEGTLTISGTGAMMNYYDDDYYYSSPWHSSRESIKKVIISDGVTSIGNYAFYYCGSLQSVTIPDSVTIIGEEAFFYCSSLQSVTIPDSVTSIGGYAFESCSSLQSVTIPDSVTSIGYGAFYKCSSLQSVTIPDSVTSIGCGAFENCSSLQSVTIPDSVTSIEGSAFRGCSSLQSITIPDSVTSIGGYAFEGCSSLQSVTIPDSVTSIGGYAFEYCSSLKTITVGNGVESIGEYAFLSCSNIQSVYIEDLTKWLNINFGDTSYSNPLYNDARLYLNGKKVTDVTFPEGTTEIGSQLVGCKSIVNVTIPDTVTSIGKNAFSGCDSLETVNIPASVTSVGAYAFSSCDSLKGVYIEDLTKWFEVDFDADYSNPLSNTADLYLNGEKVTDVTFPAGTTEIGTQLKGCTSLVNVTLPDSVTTIEEEAFYWCGNLYSITIPETVTFIGEYAFSGCRNLSSVAYTKDLSARENIDIEKQNDCLLNATWYYNSCKNGHVYSAVCDETCNSCDFRRGVVHTYSYSCDAECDVCNAVRNDWDLYHANLVEHDEVRGTCVTNGYTSGSFCNDCQTYFIGHWDMGKDPSNHVNTKNVPATPATYDAIGYTEGVYCNDCNQYISGHVEIPKLENIGDIDGDGQLTASDARFALRASVGLDNLSDAQKAAADADGDGQLTASDARLILRASVGLEDPKNWKK